MPVTIFKSCENPGECANVLLTRRAASKEVQYDALTNSKQGNVDVATTRGWGQVARVWSHEVLVLKAADRHHEAKSRPEDRGNQMGA